MLTTAAVLMEKHQMSTWKAGNHLLKDQILLYGGKNMIITKECMLTKVSFSFILFFLFSLIRSSHSLLVYVRLDRVTAVDFLRVQLDTEFRKQWDTSATELKIIEESPERNSDLVYWRTQWPVLFKKRNFI